MNSENSQAYKLITNPVDLRRLANQLSIEPVIAVDTESNSLYAFREQVCLLQFSTKNVDFLVDPLVIEDLSPLAPVFENKEIEKVFHAAEYDVICMKRDFEFQFNNIFDTMVASRILGREAVGLSSLLETEFGVKVDKQYQRANWGQRPLPRHLLDYASQDTHYLIDLRNRLGTELTRRGLEALAQEDFTRLTQVENNHDHPKDAHLSCRKVRGAADLSSQQMAVLQELCQYRISVAKSTNRPLFKVIQDSTLIALAVKAPYTLEELSHVPGMSHSQVHRHGYQILQAIRRGQRAEPIFPSRPARPSDAYLQRYERLRQWRKQTGDIMQVQSDVIMPRELMEALAQHNPGNREEMAVILDSVPYRLEQFGNQILKVLHPSKGQPIAGNPIPNSSEGLSR